MPANKLRVLVVGSGAREHALCCAIATSPHCGRLLVAPGNPGIRTVAECCDVAAGDIAGLVALAKREQVDLVVVGPEVPLVAGLVDRLNEAGIKAFGPDAAAARLEGSKGFMKEIAQEAGIPTAAFRRFDNAEEAKAYIRQEGAPIVVKADGLAAGKGVVVARSVPEALAAVDAIMAERRFGDAGARVVVEAFLEGEEASFFVLCDGVTALPLGSAQDHKAVGDGDTGPNTGGMGAYSPAPAVTPQMERGIMAEIIEPALVALRARGCPFRGVLFAGLMLTDAGPKLIEFNVRFGDPECEVLMPRLKSDVLQLLMAAADGKLNETKIEWDPRPALGVVMAAQGYPGEPLHGSRISGLDRALKTSDSVQIFHAGTAEQNGQLVANGGRVLVVTALGDTVADAQRRAYAAVDAIDWPQGFCRRDIGWRAVAREVQALGSLA